MYRGSRLRNTLNTGYITGLDMCQVCTEAVDCVALRIDQEKTQKRCPGFRAVGKNMNFNTKNTFLYILVSCSFSLLKTSISTVAHSTHLEFHPVPRQETGRSPLSLRAMWRTARVQQGDHDASR